jgi:hypothetical protein
VAATGGSAIFPRASARAGMYESFYLRAVDPARPRGIWIRHTVHKRPGAGPRGSVWCTVFDADRGRPFVHKLTSERLDVPAGGWIAVGQPESDARAGESEGACFTPELAHGRCGGAAWRLRWSSQAPELRHLGGELPYRLPVPRTKLTSPAPHASFDGTLELPDRDAIELRGWQGMVGHNWGSEHAERWIWLHALVFDQTPDAWLDVAIGRVRMAGRLTPWVANGALSIGSRRWRLGGLRVRGVHVRESPDGCELELPGGAGLALGARVHVPTESAAGWRYADPDGSEHDVVNCSIAKVELDVRTADGAATQTLTSAHGGAYELGMREHDHGVPLAPFTDG